MTDETKTGGGTVGRCHDYEQAEQGDRGCPRQDTLKERFAREGIEPVGSSAAEFDKAIRFEIARLTKLVEAANLRIK